MKKLLVLFLVFSLNGYAVTPLKKGQPSPEDGFLFNKQEEKEVRKKNEENKILKGLTIKQDELIKNQDQQIGLLEGKLKKRDVSGLEKTLYFIAGVLFTSGSVYLAGKLRD